ncbi:hypothetical protein [Amedibacillus sp. YH-ame10]
MLQKKLKTKDIDLLNAFKKKKEPSKYASIMKYAIPPVILAVIIAGVFGYVTLQSIGMQGDIDEMNVKIKQLEKKIAEDPNVAKANTLQGIYANTEKYKKLYEDIQSYPQLSQGTFDQLIISGNGKVTITGFHYTRVSQAITVTIQTATESNTEEFVRNLKASGEFAKVTYAGYAASEKANEGTSSSSNNSVSNILGNITKSEQETVKETVYSATVECILK